MANDELDATGAQPEADDSQEEVSDQNSFRLPPPRITFSADGVEAYLTLFEARAFHSGKSHPCDRTRGRCRCRLAEGGAFSGRNGPCEVELIARGRAAAPTEDAGASSTCSNVTTPESMAVGLIGTTWEASFPQSRKTHHWHAGTPR